MECAAHPGALSVATCSVCSKSLCSPCATYEVDGAICCETCGRTEEDRARSLGSALLGFVGVGYLATLAIAVLVFHARPFVGGIAAIAAIALGRLLQMVLRPPVVARRLERR